MSQTDQVHPIRPRRTRARPTMEDVAAVAGVSRGTISRALNGGRYVSPAAMAAIRKAIAQTGYVVNPHARGLVTNRSNTVAFILSEPQERLFDDPNFNILLRGCTQALAAHDIMLVMAIASSAADRERVGRYVHGGHVDGALLVSTHSGNPIMNDLRGIPVVACGAPLGHEHDIAYVAADDRGGAQQMTRYLRDRGCRVVATIAGPPDTPGGVQRLAGWRDLLGAEASDRLVAIGDYTREGGEAAMNRLLASAPELDAVFVASDLMAAGALAALRHAGRRVPEDVALGGFDDSPVATSVQPALTTIRQPLLRITTELVRLLRDLIDGQPPARVILPTELIRRDSA